MGYFHIQCIQTISAAAFFNRYISETHTLPLFIKYHPQCVLLGTTIYAIENNVITFYITNYGCFSFQFHNIRISYLRFTINPYLCRSDFQEKTLTQNAQKLILCSTTGDQSKDNQPTTCLCKLLKVVYNCTDHCVLLLFYSKVTALVNLCNTVNRVGVSLFHSKTVCESNQPA